MAKTSSAVCLIFFLFSSVTLAHEGMSGPEDGAPAAFRDCGDWATFDPLINSCRELPRMGDREWHGMVHGNAFVVGDVQTGQRQLNKLVAPNWLMGQAGRALSAHHYFNVDLMLTAERWTYPAEGYPEFAQIGERDDDDKPYVDAQHPHSSPIMGLTVSDTILLDEQHNFVRIFASPRGSSTDGPVPFMHRASGEVNPDAPLGHHMGQDVGHIASTVVGGALKMGNNQVEASAFNGEEPAPTHVDMQLGELNSLALRYTRYIGEHYYAMASMAYVKNPGESLNRRDSQRRYSASIYMNRFIRGWLVNNALIYGLASHLDGLRLSTSIGEEFVAERSFVKIFGRVEYVERTAQELAISVGSDPLKPRGLAALTAGVTHRVWHDQGCELGLGGSLSQLFLPPEYQGAYSGNPWTARLFLQFSGMKMM